MAAFVWSLLCKQLGMPNELKVFKKLVADSWRMDFPFLKQVDIDEVPRVEKGCNFLCDLYGESRKRYYFLRINFSPKRRGEFSVGISISPSPARSILEHPLVSPELTPFSIGMFGIWKFLDLPRFDWALVDIDSEQNALFSKLGLPGIKSGSRRSANVWRPSTYDQPFFKIAEEAVSHLNYTLRSRVFPVLEISL